MPFPVLNLKQWVDEHRHLLKPPVGNKEVYPGGDFIVMIVGGPNARRDYHYNETPEFFYQIEGDIVLRIVEEGEFKDISIKEGEIFLLPACIPHSPQRPEGSVGLVIEQKRGSEYIDKFLWYCDKCQTQLHEVSIPVDNIVSQLPQVFAKFKANTDMHRCSACGHIHSF